MYITNFKTSDDVTRYIITNTKDVTDVVTFHGLSHFTLDGEFAIKKLIEYFGKQTGTTNLTTFIKTPIEEMVFEEINSFDDVIDRFVEYII